MFLSRIEAVNNITLLHRYYFSLEVILYELLLDKVLLVVMCPYKL